MLVPLQLHAKHWFWVSLAVVANWPMAVSALSSVYLVSRPPYMLNYQYVVYGLEALLWTLTSIINGVFIVALWQTRTIHRNMRILVITMCACYIVVGCVRYSLLYNHFYNDKAFSTSIASFIRILQNIFISAKTSSEIALLAERVCATKLSNNYETMQSNFIAGVFLISCFIYPAITIPLSTTNIVGPVMFLPLPVIFDILSWIFLIILLKINKRSFVTAIDNAKLSQRYQIVENLRTLRCIRWFLAYSTFSNAVTVGWYAYFVFYINEVVDNDLYVLYDATWWLINAISAMVLSLPFLLPHATLRKRFL
uniref:G protein-coupled receptor n=1 Tax=Panagrellus redivivus TaxID=6233 RepID=A0A7E4V9V9_PANRE